MTRLRSFALECVFAVRARVAERLRALPSDEEGGSMVFGAITLFSLMLFILFVYQTGMTSSHRMQMQTAADYAAYSAALVEADALDAIAFTNEGMSYVYYNELRYAVDACVYGTLDEFTRHQQWVQQNRPEVLTPPTDMRITMAGDVAPPDNPNAPDWVPIGGDGSQFRQRRDAAFDHARRLLPEGKRWLADLHDGERAIFGATPRLAMRAAARVAYENGAVAVGVSSGLEQVFSISRGMGDNTSGFTEGGSDQGQGSARPVDRALYRRYETRALGVDKRAGMPAARELPSAWFDASTGEATGDDAYFQVRLCWNGSDWGHGNPMKDPQYVPHEMAMGPYQQYNQGAPNGHWHRRHVHNVINLDTGAPAVLPPGGHDKPHVPPDVMDHDFSSQDFELAPSELTDLPHHCAQICPTCDAKDGGVTTGWTQIRKTLGDAIKRFQMDGGGRDMVRVRFDGAGEVLPRPIKARAVVFSTGITVAAWMPCTGISNYMPANPTGILAIGSAQIGLRRQNGAIAVATQVHGEQVTFEDGTTIDLANDPSFRNMFYASEDARGMRFGARLVPVGRDLTWGAKTPGRGLADLLGGGTGPGAGRWLTAEGEPTTMPTELQRLPESLDVEASAKAFWH